jgi:TetR/AcrR family transcriptional regulator, transcriptional repressor for nem operon
LVRQSVAATQESRRRLLRSASRLMREHGYNGVGIDAIAADAGLTPGAFYRHFSSKSDLFAEVVNEALAVAEKHLPSIDNAAGVQRFIEVYLSDRAVRELGEGCVVAAMSSDLARHGGAPRSAAAAYVAVIQRRIEAALLPELGDEAASVAWRLVAQLVGAVVVARLLPQDLAQAVLGAARTPAGDSPA